MKLAALSITVAICVVSASAYAQSTRDQLGTPGQVAISVDRLFGLSWSKENEASHGYTTLSLIGASGWEVMSAPYSIPRMAFDVFVARGFSVGTGAQIATISQDGDSVTLIGFNPRLGYAVSLSEDFSLWPRLGVSYVNVNGERDGDSAYLLAMSAELMFVASFARHFGMSFSPTGDLGLGATRSRTVDQIGVQAGLLGWW